MYTFTSREHTTLRLWQMWLPVTNAWQLNERHYGGLTGLNKQETVEKCGEEQVRQADTHIMRIATLRRIFLFGSRDSLSVMFIV